MLLIASIRQEFFNYLRASKMNNVVDTGHPLPQKMAIQTVADGWLWNHN